MTTKNLIQMYRTMNDAALTAANLAHQGDPDARELLPYVLCANHALVRKLDNRLTLDCPGRTAGGE